MELTNDFRVGVPVEQAWAVLTDVERIAPCMPGAQLQEIEGDEYRGIVKVKVGPITAQYKGAADVRREGRGEPSGRARAEGRDTRGQGNATATITATLEPDGDGTKVIGQSPTSRVTGKVAQFGRGVMADVSAKLLDQFVDCLERRCSRAVGPGGGAPRAATAGSGARAERGDAGRPTPRPRHRAARHRRPAHRLGGRAAVDLSAQPGRLSPSGSRRSCALVAVGWLLRVLLRRRRR